MTDTTIISQYEHVFTEGKDFDSSNVRMICGGIDTQGQPFIGVSWNASAVYWYEVDKDEVDNMAFHVEENMSIGSYAAELAKKYTNFHFEDGGAYSRVMDAHNNKVPKAKTNIELMRALAMFNGAMPTFA